jgi:hypothetical protein
VQRSTLKFSLVVLNKWTTYISLIWWWTLYVPVIMLEYIIVNHSVSFLVVLVVSLSAKKSSISYPDEITLLETSETKVELPPYPNCWIWLYAFLIASLVISLYFLICSAGSYRLSHKKSSRPASMSSFNNFLSRGGSSLQVISLRQPFKFWGYWSNNFMILFYSFNTV